MMDTAWCNIEFFLLSLSIVMFIRFEKKLGNFFLFLLCEWKMQRKMQGVEYIIVIVNNP